MSDIVATQDALFAVLESNRAAFGNLPVYYPNDDRDTPTLAVAKKGFVVARVNVQDEGAISLGPDGARFHRDQGELAVYIYVPRGSRSGDAMAHAQAIRQLFKTNAVQGVTIERRVIGRGDEVEGPKGASRAYCVPVFVEWFTDRLE